MPQAFPVPRVLLAYTGEGLACVRSVRTTCEWPSIPGTSSLDDVVETILVVLEDAHGFRIVERSLLGHLIAREVFSHLGHPEIECGPVTGRRGRRLDDRIARLSPKDLVQICWHVSRWLHLCAQMDAQQISSV